MTLDKFQELDFVSKYAETETGGITVQGAVPGNCFPPTGGRRNERLRRGALLLFMTTL